MPRQKPYAVRKLKSMPKWRIFVLALIPVAVIAGLINLSPIRQMLPGNADRTVVHLATQPQFKVKRNSEVLGVNIMQIADKREPQDFLILNNVPAAMVEPMLGHTVDKRWATEVANQFLKKRDPDSSTPPPTVEIQEIHATQQGTVEYEGKQLPYWQVQVQFKLGQEAESRSYEGGIIRNADGNDKGADTVVVAYAQKGAFRKELLPELMQHLSFETVSP